MPSFNVQNAKSLEITEGDVATIHDADGCQLWGKLNYTTKYQGDTEQTTYEGKNLFNKNATPTSGLTQNTITILDSGIRVTTTTGGTYKYVEYVIGDISSYAGKYLLTTATITPSAENAGRIQLGLCKSDGTDKLSKSALSATGTASFAITAADVADRPYLYLYAYSNLNGTGVADDYVDYTNFQLEVSSSTTAITYEPYVGGVPAPNPDYPQSISVVTGTQTVTLTGGTVSEDYTVHLGTLELAKLATYQDYIFKSNDNWYKHTVIGKAILTGDADESWAYQSGDHQRFTHVIDDIKLASDQTDKVPLVCDHFTTTTVASIYNGQNYAIASHYGSHQIWVSYFTYTSSNDFKTWLSTHNTTLYYPLDSTAVTDTQITDTDLIAELDAIEEFMTRCGYTASVAGNLPIVINQTEIV